MKYLTFLIITVSFLLPNSLTADFKDKYNDCAVKYNKCRTLLKKADKELGVVQDKLDKTVERLETTSESLEPKWFPVQLGLLGFVSYEVSAAIYLQGISLEPLDIFVIENLSLNIGAGPEAYLTSISYSLKGTWFDNTTIHILWGSGIFESKVFNEFNTGAGIGLYF